MKNAQTNGNQPDEKPAWKRPIEKDKYTADEIERIKASRAVMRVIEKQIERGDFDYILKKDKKKK